MNLVTILMAAQLTITVSSDPTEGGTVERRPEREQYSEGDIVTLRATTHEGYEFTQWSDGDRTNPRTITVTAAAHYSARFERVTPAAGTFTTADLGGGVAMDLVWIPPGTFTMGSPASEGGRDSDETLHQVTLTRGFWMGATEVTQAQWEAVMGTNPSNFTGANRPVEQVAWGDCVEFCRRVSQRTGQTFDLPTEAEWEYACRAGTPTAYSFGNSESELGSYAWYDANSNDETHDVRQKRENAWGLYDMHGNVFEWCTDWYGEYPIGAVRDPTGPASGESRVVRGGSKANDPQILRAAYRVRSAPGDSFIILGMRAVRR